MRIPFIAAFPALWRLSTKRPAGQVETNDCSQTGLPLLTKERKTDLLDKIWDASTTVAELKAAVGVGMPEAFLEDIF